MFVERNCRELFNCIESIDMVKLIFHAHALNLLTKCDHRIILETIICYKLIW